VEPSDITVAIATRGRPAGLRRCLAALAAGTAAPGEVLVVDQEPSAASREIVAAFGARHIEQNGLRGLSVSRNGALAAASCAVLACTDDDCVPDPRWVAVLATTFERAPALAAVSGAILPLGPQPPDTFAVSLRTETATVDHTGRLIPWTIGSGGNFAARCTTLRDLGGWDERLGAGSRGRAAEDADLFHRILRTGGTVRYEPSAIVRHEWQSLERRLATRSSYGYGIGALAGIWLRRGDPLALRMLTTYARYHLRPLARAVAGGDADERRERWQALAGVPGGVAYGLGARTRQRAYDSPRMDQSVISASPPRPSAGVAPSSPSRDALWRCAALFAATVAFLAVVLTDWQSPMRTAVALVYLLFVPGLALTEAIQVRDHELRLTIATSSSLAIETVVALVLIYTRAWSIVAAEIILGALTVLILQIAVVRARRALRVT